jgi:hypothetical protein
MDTVLNNLVPLVSVWVLLALIVISMALYRHRLVRHVDATLDLLEDSRVAGQQTREAKRADAVERWGKVLTVLVLLYGLVIAASYLHQAWQSGTQIPK